MTDFFEILDAPVKPQRGHGGARTGSGTKPAGYKKPPEAVDYDKARARNEIAKADMNELEFKIKSSEYISRTAFRQASATAVATLAQTMRSIEDNLERKGVSLEVCKLVGITLDEAMATMASDLEMMAGTPE